MKYLIIIKAYHLHMPIHLIRFHLAFATSSAISTLFSSSKGIGTKTKGQIAGTLNPLNINAINSIQFDGNDISHIYILSNIITSYLLP
jgi:hypothetical protein